MNDEKLKEWAEAQAKDFVVITCGGWKGYQNIAHDIAKMLVTAYKAGEHSGAVEENRACHAVATATHEMAKKWGSASYEYSAKLIVEGIEERRERLERETDAREGGKSS